MNWEVGTLETELAITMAKLENGYKEMHLCILCFVFKFFP